MSISPDSVVVVGAGISGVACARELVAAGLPVVVLDRSRVVGGRMARWTRDGRAIDVGAAYFTVRTPEFRAVAESWATRGLAHPWCDRFGIVGSAGAHGSGTVGDAAAGDGRPFGSARAQIRWSAENGLRSLVADLAESLDVRLGHDVASIGLARGSSRGAVVDGEPVRAVVLAMPDPQASDLLGDDLAEAKQVLDTEWRSVVTVVASFAERTWPAFDGLFVHGSPLSLIVDDGHRRGDGAPVLVAHTTHDAALSHLDDPAGAVEPVLTEMRRLVAGVGEPVWAEAKRWGSAEPSRTRSEPFWRGTHEVALCGDGWSLRPRVEGAWLSGRDAGRALAQRLR
jgi:renalase